MKKRKICVVTGSRAEYGLMYWLLKDMQADPEIELQLVVTGMHLSEEFGATWRKIEEDGFNITRRVDMLLSGDSPVAISKSMGLGLIGFAQVFLELEPDIVVLPCDRFEILSAAQAALVGRIPIAHIHGGELSEGAIDDAIRHSITKMSHLHFVSTEIYRKRVIQLGEKPDLVFNVGAPGLDQFHRSTLLGRKELESKLNFSLGEKCFMVTYHPETLGHATPESVLKNLLDAIDCFPEAKIILTYPNADTFGRKLISQIKEYADERPDRVLISSSLGQLLYLSALKEVDLVIGNSSSGLVEAPSFCTPTVNIGNRQRGRLKAQSVIDCEENKEAVEQGIIYALSEEFQIKSKKTINPYFKNNTSKEILSLLKNISIEGLLVKNFHDIPNEL
jgi:GDP/UDP-N,N'-diacetylbacillosamine 2-epimerase (hydrolysing)